MTRFLKSAVLAFAVAATSLTAVADANAGDGWRRTYYNNYYKGRSTGDVVAAGVLGLAAGAIIGGLIARPAYREPVYADGYRQAPNYYGNGAYNQPRYVGGGLEPWSREWFRYCESRYRSFDPGSGTFVGYDGREHFCR
jgi:hypothetical protein